MVKTFKAKLLEKKQLVKGIFLFKFRLDKDLRFLAGQYLVLKVPHNDTAHRKMFSIASALDQKRDVDMIVKLYPNGIASTYLKNLKVGDEVEFEGPDGMFKIRENNKEKIFLALGVGIAPILSILKTNLPIRLEKMMLIWGLKTKNDIFLINEIKTLDQKYPEQFHYYICLSQDTDQRERIVGGRVDKLIEKMFPMGDTEALNKYDYYLCGDESAVHSLRVWLNEKGVEDENIILEQFT